MVIAGVCVPVIGPDDLIATKRAAGREEDLIAARRLEKRRDRDVKS
jgi:hypothetical protein